MSTTVRAVADISAPGASRTNGHEDRGTRENAPGSRVILTEFRRSSLQIGWNPRAWRDGHKAVRIGARTRSN
jgi:hypothetical protein